LSETNLLFRPATELAAMVRSGEVSARELVQSSLEKIEELDPKLNAFVQVDAEGALQAADQRSRTTGRSRACGSPTAAR